MPSVGTIEYVFDDTLQQLENVLIDLIDISGVEVLSVLGDEKIIYAREEIYSYDDEFLGTLVTIYSTATPEAIKKVIEAIRKEEIMEKNKDRVIQILEELAEVIPKALSKLKELYGERESYVIIV